MNSTYYWRGKGLFPLYRSSTVTLSIFPLNAKRCPVKVVEGDGRAEIDSNVETLAGSKGGQTRCA